jgi:hypothetical protein
MQIQRDQLVYFEACVNEKAEMMFLSTQQKNLFFWHVWFRSDVYELRIRSQMKRDYPLNLSILIRGGKENNNDSPSNGEWSGKSSNWKSATQAGCRIVA